MTYLNVLYPRSMFSRRGEDWVLEGVSGIGELLPELLRGIERVADDRLRFIQADPNRPQFNREPLEGTWIPGDGTVTFPPTITRQAISLLHNLGITFFQVQLEHPIDPLDSRWFCWKFHVDDCGIVVNNSPIGPVVFHQISSPFDVRRTAKEEIESVQRKAEEAGPPWLAALAREMRETTFGLGGERLVEIEYFELVVQPGPPHERLILNWSSERDLRMRSRSPRWAEDPTREPKGELLYEWKSGSLLKPEGAPWKGEGFLLHLTVATK